MHDDIESLIDDYERGRITRRRLVALLAAAAAFRWTPGRAAAAEAAATFTATGVDHVALRVTDVPASGAFYRRHLGLEPMGSCSEGQCFLRCGDDFLALFRGSTPGLDHYAFAVEGYRPGDAVARLREAGLSPERRGDRVYFPDPDGIEVQVTAG